MELQRCKSETIYPDGYHDCVLFEHHTGKHVPSKIAHKKSKWRISSCLRFVKSVGRKESKIQKLEYEHHG